MYGIDLGTSNSAIARFDGEQVTVFKNKEQMDVTPSAVLVGKNGRIHVGRKAYEARISQPGNVAVAFKRIIGQADRVTFDGVDKAWSPEELSAEILKSLLDDARRAMDAPVGAVVVTVPADFSQLQCEATARAAKLAGLQSAALLQEPIAAAIAYGLKPDSRDKCWLVYDLGGGTFDMALISTQDGRLTVIEHAGDNTYGGKDIDQAIVTELLLPEIAQMFNLPDLDGEAGRKLKRALYKAAEEAKVELSSIDTTLAAVFEAGTDRDGDEIELEVEITRRQLDDLVTPMVMHTIEMCRAALERAALKTPDVTSLILVGGPTNMPRLRELLAAELAIPLEYGIDPMTVVARGAAVYAAGIAVDAEPAADQDGGAVILTLAYEPVSPATNPTVLGRVQVLDDSARPVEVQIDAESEHWSSGWLPITDDLFETTVLLLPERTTAFRVSLRDSEGAPVIAVPDRFQIRHGIAVGAPPLPHSIGAEVRMPDGRLAVDVLFPRSTALPAQADATYRTHRMLRPSQAGDSLSFKVWEGEYGDPESNTWLGALKIHAADLTRPIPEGAEVRVHVSLDTSRRMQVSLYIPVIDETFEEQVYLPEEEEHSAMDDVRKLIDGLGSLSDLVSDLLGKAHRVGDTAAWERLKQLQRLLEELTAETRHVHRDPDSSKRLLKRLKDARGAVMEQDKHIENTHGVALLKRELNDVSRVVEFQTESHGSAGEREELARLLDDADEWARVGDMKGIRKVIDALNDLWWGIVSRQPDYWRERFARLESMQGGFAEKTAARSLIDQGREVRGRGDLMGLAPIVKQLWRLLPERPAKQEQTRGLDGGLRKG